jgi:hypothetical protein
MGSCMLALAIASGYPKDNDSAAIASAFFLYLVSSIPHILPFNSNKQQFNFFVPIGFLGANFLYCAEVAPLKLRVSMASISTANHWLWNFVIVMITPVAIASIGSHYFIIFCVISYCIPLSVYLFYPETMGQSLEQIDAVFRDNDNFRAIVRASKLCSKGDVDEIVKHKGPNEQEIEDVKQIDDTDSV